MYYSMCELKRECYVMVKYYECYGSHAFVGLDSFATTKSSRLTRHFKNNLSTVDKHHLNSLKINNFPFLEVVIKN